MEKQYDNHLHERKAQQLWLEHNTYAAKNNPGQFIALIRRRRPSRVHCILAIFFPIPIPISWRAIKE